MRTGELPHLSGRVTSPTWGPPRPCKQALTLQPFRGSGLTSERKNDMILIFILSILYSFDVVFRSFTFEYLVTIKNYNNDTNN